MTDWQNDLRRLARLYAHPEDYDSESVGEIVVGFLYHALAHVQAAAELMLDYRGFSFPKE